MPRSSLIGSAVAALLALPGAWAAIAPGSNNIGAVWFIGDSITQSNADGDSNGSPRKSLYDLLVANGYTFTYTGHYTANVDGLPATGGTADTNLYQYHSGISGSVIGDNFSGRTGMTQNTPSFWTSGRLATVKPNVILIMLGTNDVDQNIDLANAPARLTTLVRTLCSNNRLSRQHWCQRGGLDHLAPLRKCDPYPHPTTAAALALAPYESPLAASAAPRTGRRWRGASLLLTEKWRPPAPGSPVVPVGRLQAAV